MGPVVGLQWKEGSKQACLLLTLTTEAVGLSHAVMPVEQQQQEEQRETRTVHQFCAKGHGLMDTWTHGAGEERDSEMLRGRGKLGRGRREGEGEGKAQRKAERWPWPPPPQRKKPKRWIVQRKEPASCCTNWPREG